MLPQRRKRPRMGIEKHPQIYFPRHRTFVRGRVCIVPGCQADGIQCCHVRLGHPEGTPGWAMGGTSKKPHDGFTYPGCVDHHREQGDIGERSFELKYGVSLLGTAVALARISPVMEVREFVRELQT